MALGVLAFFLLPSSPEKTPFLNERERTIATERLRVETAGLVSYLCAQHDCHTEPVLQSHTEETNTKLVFRAFKSVNNWLCGVSTRLPNLMYGC